MQQGAAVHPVSIFPRLAKECLYQEGYSRNKLLKHAIAGPCFHGTAWGKVHTCFLKRMLSRKVPDMTHGCCGTYAREPWIFTLPLMPRTSPRMAASRDDLPASALILVQRRQRGLARISPHLFS